MSNAGGARAWALDEVAEERAVESGPRYLRRPADLEALRITAEAALRRYELACRECEEHAEIYPLPSDWIGSGLDYAFERAMKTFWVAFQPVVCASDRGIFGYEALLRSTEPSLPGPTDVVTAAERLGQLERLGRSVRRRAAEAFRNAPNDALLFVNLHPADLMDPELALLASPLAEVASRVVLEVTERASLASVENARSKIAELRRLGFRIAVDDLGAGYAGLSWLAQLEPDIVKIDMSLVRDIDTSPVKRKLIGSMAAVCRDIGLRVVAEGIETRGERDTVVDLGCDLLQGRWFAGPAPAFPEAHW